MFALVILDSLIEKVLMIRSANHFKGVKQVNAELTSHLQLLFSFYEAFFPLFLQYAEVEC